MTSSRMGRLYIEEARARLALVRLALERGLWAATVREAQECVELFLKGALRLVAVEPARTHDVAEVLKSEAARSPRRAARRVKAEGQGRNRDESTVKLTIRDLTTRRIHDPDAGLDIRENVRKRLLRQKRAVSKGHRGEPLENVVRRLKLA
jgi:HEPN domain-containing protein